MRQRRTIVFAVLVLLVAVQFIPVRRTNPSGGAEIVAAADVKAVLERSCYDCHSNDTKWPWYSYLAPVSWLIAHDVNEGREQLNFSVWREYAAKDRAHLSEEAVEEVSRGGMPIKAYLFLHRGATIGPGEVDVFRAVVKELEEQGRSCRRLRSSIPPRGSCNVPSRSRARALIVKSRRRRSFSSSLTPAMQVASILPRSGE